MLSIDAARAATIDLFRPLRDTRGQPPASTGDLRGGYSLITIHRHPVRAGKQSSRLFSIKNESIRLAALKNDDGVEVDYEARIVRTRDLGMGYGRGIYTFDRLIQVPPEANDGDELYLLVDHDSQFHTHYHLELHPDEHSSVLKAYRLAGDSLVE